MNQRGAEPTFFTTPQEFWKWMEAHHKQAGELWVGFHKIGSGQLSMTWPESVDVALCFGWIDGVRQRVDAASYVIRFTPRRARSVWSLVNIRKVEEQTAKGLMRPAGLAAFQQRTGARSGIYSFEQGQAAQLTDEHEKQFQTNFQAWEFFQRQAPWYRRAASWWVISAKKEETRLRRLVLLMEHSASGNTLPQLTRQEKSGITG